MSPTVRPYRGAPESRSDSNIFIPLFLILSLAALVSSVQAGYLLQPKDISASAAIRIILSKLIYFWYFVLVAFVVQWHSKRIAAERRSVVAWFCIHLLTLALSFFIHETLSLEVERFIWPIEPRGTLFYALFNNPSVWIEILMYALFVLGFSALEYRRSVREKEIICSQLEMLLVKSKLQELRNKIRPTFLFQTLQTILELVGAGRNKDANHILSMLSDFLRTTVYDTDREEIALEEEIRFLNRYLEIENIRSRRSISIIEEIQPEAADAAVPNFIIQPIADELISRTAEFTDRQHIMKIGAGRTNDNLEVTIEDRCGSIDEDPKNAAEREAVFAITRERLLQLYGDDQELTVRSQPDGVVLVKIRIPFREVPQSEATLIAEAVP